MIATDWGQFYDRAKLAWDDSALLQYSYADLQTYCEHLLIAYGRCTDHILVNGLAVINAESVDAKSALARMRAARAPVTSGMAYRLADRVGPRLVLWLYGPVAKNGGGCGINADAVCEVLHANADALGIYLRIDSSGGSLSDARAIASALARHPARKVAIVDRTCWSASVYIAAAANRVLIRADATMMVHPAVCSARGDSRELGNKGIELYCDDQAYQVWLTSHRIRIDSSSLRELWESERIFGAVEAVELGFADTVIPALPSSIDSAGPDQTPGEAQ